MKIQTKQAIVEQLSAKFDEAKAFYLTDFTGLDVKNMTELRARLRGAGVEYLVVKNTLALRALDGVEMPDIAEFFKGPTGLVIGREDAVTAAKVLDEFAQEHDDKPIVKVGILERQKITPDEIKRLAKLPPREQLLAELAGAFEAPMSQLAFFMGAMLNEFAGLLEALRAQKESE